MKDEESTLFKGLDPIYIQRKIQEAEEAQQLQQSELSKLAFNSQGQIVAGKQLPLSTRLAKYITKTRTDDIIEALNALLSFLLTFFFAMDTYYQGGSPLIITYCEYVIMILSTLDFLLFFFIDDNRLFYIFSFQSIISYITIIPTFLVRAGIVTDPSKVDTLLLFRVFRFFSIMRMDDVFARRSMTIFRVWFRLIYIFIATVIIFAALLL